MMRALISSLGLIFLTSLPGVSAPLIWTGATADLSVASNWNPASVPTISDNATFNAASTTKQLLTPGGTDFSVSSATFTSGNFSFDTSGFGDVINFGNGVSGGGLVVSNAAAVDFNDQSIFLNNSMSWSVSGGSQFSSSGTVDTTNDGVETGYALTLAFGAGQTNNRATFQEITFGTTGSLTVTNWGGAVGQFGGTNNQLRFFGTVSQPPDLTNIKFTVGVSTLSSAAQNFGSYWEVVPVPEPATCVLLAGGMTCLGILRLRRMI